jgi:ornithine cyclodeaminase/alanine dehydrogenase-like protein (mu-crystallin family)
MHLNLLGADAAGKSEASITAVACCRCVCDEWAQAAHGGELHGAVAAGLLRREDVAELGAVLAGETGGRPGLEAVTLFDSTGLAIQDLAIALACLGALREGRVEVPSVNL